MQPRSTGFCRLQRRRFQPQTTPLMLYAASGTGAGSFPSLLSSSRHRCCFDVHIASHCCNSASSMHRNSCFPTIFACRANLCAAGLRNEFTVWDVQVTCIYLFHELPPDVRTKVAQELARVVKPGGMVVVTDSAQMGDRPLWDKVGRLCTFRIVGLNGDQSLFQYLARGLRVRELNPINAIRP